MFCYLLLSWGLRGWLIDDAGISFAYARSIAEGYGMVSQPGALPVEGISNPFWTLIYVPFFFFGLFDALLVAKGLSLLFVLFSLFLVVKISNRLTDGTLWAIALVLFGTVLSAPVAIWCVSGLENPLYAASVLLLVYISVSFSGFGKSAPGKWGIIAGSVAALTALTRPEGVLLPVIFVVAIAGWWLYDRALSGKETARALGCFGLAFTVLFGGYILFRVCYFGDWFPNTYYVKGGPDTMKAINALTLQGEYLNKLRDFCSTFVGYNGWLLLPVAIIILTVLSCFITKQRTAVLTLVITFLVTCFTYLMMTQDWMGEYRFATAVYPVAFLCLAVLVYHLFSYAVTNSRIRSWCGWGITVLLVWGVWNVNARRLDTFVAHPPTSYFTVSERFAGLFNTYAEILHLDSASVLLPDVGGTLMNSKLTVYDLGGLCDKTIAKQRGHDQIHFYNYVFDTLRPTFIHTHGYFTAVSMFDDDPRFRGDYVAITSDSDAYVKRVYKADRISGDFVRRDAVSGREYVLDSLRAAADR